MTPELTKIYNKALDEVNKMRTTLGLDPLNEFPKGEHHSAYSCPVANALGPFVNAVYSEMTFHNPADAEKLGAYVKGHVITPDPIMDFILAFDDGQYPELKW